MRPFLLAALLGSACSSHSAESWAHDAIQCELFEQTNNSLGVLGGSSSRTLTLKRGEQGSVDLPPLTMRGGLGSEGFGVSIMHGTRQVFRGVYQFGAPFPENQFIGQHGFTGLIYLDVPGRPANYQLICKAVASGPDPDRRSRSNEERERSTKAQLAAFVATLQSGSTPERAVALKGLHAHRIRTFKDLKVAGATLDGADLRESQMPNADFTGASLKEASLYFNQLERASFERANLQGANLYAAKLANANLREANLHGAGLERAHLEHASLVSANLSGAYLAYAALEQADLSNANLEGANLTAADLRSANLHGANLKGAQLKDAQLQGAQLDGALHLTPQQRAAAKPD